MLVGLSMGDRDKPLWIQDFVPSRRARSAVSRPTPDGLPCKRFTGSARKEDIMLWTIVVILLVLWLLGMVSSYTVGGLIHILLVIAIIVVVVRLIQGRRVL